jgi:hypothetical protein
VLVIDSPSAASGAAQMLLRAQFIHLTSRIITECSASEVLSLVATAYRSLPEGSVAAMRGRLLADEVEATGDYLFDKYGI